MLEELIMREERTQNHVFLFLLGIVSVLVAVKLATVIFAGQADIVAVFLAAMPLVYPLTAYFLKDEKEKRPHLPEIEIYASLFLGEMVGFFAVGLFEPTLLSLQINMIESSIVKMGITGYATGACGFLCILLNNMVVTGFILLVSSILGSAGAFILTWNASVLGVFLAVLTREIISRAGHAAIPAGAGNIPSPLAYVPHASVEMSGFIVAGIAGSMISAAVYRKHFDRETWSDFADLVGFAVSLILTGAALETSVVPVFIAGVILSGFFASRFR
jgi:uncharacterized membrane protein SpoIIM required for sporulation